MGYYCLIIKMKSGTELKILETGNIMKIRKEVSLVLCSHHFIQMVCVKKFLGIFDWSCEIKNETRNFELERKQDYKDTRYKTGYTEVKKKDKQLKLTQDKPQGTYNEVATKD